MFVYDLGRTRSRQQHQRILMSGSLQRQRPPDTTKNKLLPTEIDCDQLNQATSDVIKMAPNYKPLDFWKFGEEQLPIKEVWEGKALSEMQDIEITPYVIEQVRQSKNNIVRNTIEESEVRHIILNKLYQLIERWLRSTDHYKTHFYQVKARRGRSHLVQVEP